MPAIKDALRDWVLDTVRQDFPDDAGRERLVLDYLTTGTADADWVASYCEWRGLGVAVT